MLVVSASCWFSSLFSLLVGWPTVCVRNYYTIRCTSGSLPVSKKNKQKKIRVGDVVGGFTKWGDRKNN